MSDGSVMGLFWSPAAPKMRSKQSRSARKPIGLIQGFVDLSTGKLSPCKSYLFERNSSAKRSPSCQSAGDQIKHLALSSSIGLLVPIEFNFAKWSSTILNTPQRLKQKMLDWVVSVLSVSVSRARESH